MKILGRRVLLEWEVFNWHGYMGCSYIRITSPISQEFMKIPSVPSAVEENKWKETLNTLSLSFSSFSQSRNWLISRHWSSLLSLTFFTHSSLNGSIGGCCPESVRVSGLLCRCNNKSPLRDWMLLGIGATYILPAPPYSEWSLMVLQTLMPLHVFTYWLIG